MVWGSRGPGSMQPGPAENEKERKDGRRAGVARSGCSAGWRHTLPTLPTPPPAGTPPALAWNRRLQPSRLVAAYHTSVKRHSAPAMKSLYVPYVRSPTYYTVSMCTRMETGEERTGSLPLAFSLVSSRPPAPARRRRAGPCIRANYLFRRLPLRRLPDPIVRPIFGTADRTYTFVSSRFALFPLSHPRPFFMVSSLLLCFAPTGPPFLLRFYFPGFDRLVSFLFRRFLFLCRINTPGIPRSPAGGLAEIAPGNSEL